MFSRYFAYGRREGNVDQRHAHAEARTLLVHAVRRVLSMWKCHRRHSREQPIRVTLLRGALSNALFATCQSNRPLGRERRPSPVRPGLRIRDRRLGAPASIGELHLVSTVGCPFDGSRIVAR